MVIGNKTHFSPTLKKVEEVEDPKKRRALETMQATNTIWMIVGFDDKDDYFKDVEQDNRQLKVGDKIRVCRWDWNGNDEIETITKITKKDEFSAKIKTEKGSVKFDTRLKNNASFFKWSKLQTNAWIKEYMYLVDFSNCFIEF